MKRLIALSLLAALSSFGCANQKHIDKGVFIAAAKGEEYGRPVVAAAPQYYKCFFRDKAEVIAELDELYLVAIDKVTADLPPSFHPSRGVNLGPAAGEYISKVYITRHADEFMLAGLDDEDRAKCEAFYEWNKAIFVAAMK